MLGCQIFGFFGWFCSSRVRSVASFWCGWLGYAQVVFCRGLIHSVWVVMDGLIQVLQARGVVLVLE